MAAQDPWPEIDARVPVAFIAGGTGITALLPMLRRRTALGLPFSLHYYAPPHDTATDIRSLPASTHCFCCGPAPLMEALRRDAALYRPDLVLHIRSSDTAELS